MRITTEHSRSSYGIPVILDDDGEIMDPAPGVRAVRERLGITAAQLAELCGKSVRAVNNWEQGIRNVPAEALNVMGDLLKKRDNSRN